MNANLDNFNSAFETYLKKWGKVSEPQIIEAIAATGYSHEEAARLFEKCQTLVADARQLMLLEVFGKLEMQEARKQLQGKHPYLSVGSLEKAIELGQWLVAKG